MGPSWNLQTRIRLHYLPESCGFLTLFFFPPCLPVWVLPLQQGAFDPAPMHRYMSFSVASALLLSILPTGLACGGQFFGRILAEEGEFNANYFAGGADWPGLCNTGLSQSPIFINTAAPDGALASELRGGLEFGTAMGMSVINRGHQFQVIGVGLTRIFGSVLTACHLPCMLASSATVFPSTLPIQVTCETNDAAFTG
jgi:hypothetical protein